MNDALVVFSILMVVAGGLAWAWRRQRRRRLLHRRLDPSAGIRARHKPVEPAQVSVLKESGPRSSLLERMPAARSARAELAQANLKIKAPVYLLGRLLAAGCGFALLWLLTGNPLTAVTAGAVGWAAPRFVVRRKAKKRKEAFEGQLAEALDLMGGALQAGHGFLQAIDATANEMPDPMREELHRVIDRVNVGGSATDALQELTTRIDSYDVLLMASAIAVQRQAGGNLAEVLGKLSHTVRERRRIRGEVKALTGGPRLSSYIVGAIPFLLGVYFAFVSADFRETMLRTTAGNAILAFAAIWTLIGFFLSQRIASVEY
jgi:tight adherence protein B